MPMPDLDKDLLSSIATQLMAGKEVSVGGRDLKVDRTGSRRFKTLQFDMNGRVYQAIEQNRQKPSRWGQLARAGHQVVQFRDIESGKYVAVSVDGKIIQYGKRASE
jgi:hypothetical protein